MYGLKCFNGICRACFETEYLVSIDVFAASRTFATHVTFELHFLKSQN